MTREIKEWLVTIGTSFGAALLLSALGLGLFRANAHDAPTGWAYPPECCSGVDCHPYPDENVKVEGDGFRLKEGEYIPRAKAHVSPDGQYHICRMNSGAASGALISQHNFHDGKDDAIPCFWYPPPGS